MRFVPFLAVIVVLVVAGIVGVLVNPKALVSEAVYEPPEQPRLALTSEYDDEEYFIDGTLRVPNACHEAVATASLEAGETPAVRVDIVTHSAEGICLELPTDIAFSTSIEAPEGASVSAYVNGVLADVTSE